MAEIGYIIVCEDVFNNDGREFIIKKPYNVFNPYSVPGNFSFVLSFSLFELEVETEYKLKIMVIEPDGSDLINQNIDFQFTPPKNEKVHSGTLNLKFNNVLFRKEGIHKFQISIDGETKELLVPVVPSGQMEG